MSIDISEFIDFDKLSNNIIEEMSFLELSDFKTPNERESFQFLTDSKFTKEGFELMLGECSYSSVDSIAYFVYGCEESNKGEAGNYGEDDIAITIGYSLIDDKFTIFQYD
jgi:hypothetical protein